MPRLSRWFVRAALLYLVAGSTLGAALLARKGLPLPPGLRAWLPTHVEFLLVGWVLQLAFGVAYWILPRMPGGFRPRPWAAWMAFVLLNGGIGLAGLGPVAGAPGWVPATGRLLEALAALAFAVHLWPRVRTASRPLPRRGPA